MPTKQEGVIMASDLSMQRLTQSFGEIAHALNRLAAAQERLAEAGEKSVEIASSALTNQTELLSGFADAKDAVETGPFFSPDGGS